jgi:hypothetical protein
VAVIEGFDIASGEQSDQQAWQLSPRQDWATAGAGTVGTSHNASRARWQARRITGLAGARNVSGTVAY